MISFQTEETNNTCKLYIVPVPSNVTVTHDFSHPVFLFVHTSRAEGEDSEAREWGLGHSRKCLGGFSPSFHYFWDHEISFFSMAKMFELEIHRKNKFFIWMGFLPFELLRSLSFPLSKSWTWNPWQGWASTMCVLAFWASDHAASFSCKYDILGVSLKLMARMDFYNVGFYCWSLKEGSRSIMLYKWFS